MPFKRKREIESEHEVNSRLCFYNFFNTRRTKWLKSLVAANQGKLGFQLVVNHVTQSTATVRQHWLPRRPLAQFVSFNSARC